MEIKIFDKLFGHKVKVVSTYALYAYAEWEQDFIFNKNATEAEIKSTLWKRNDGKLSQFSVKFIRTFRTKTIPPIDKTFYRPLTAAKLTKWLDD